MWVGHLGDVANLLARDDRTRYDSQRQKYAINDYYDAKNSSLLSIMGTIHGCTGTPVRLHGNDSEAAKVSSWQRKRKLSWRRGEGEHTMPHYTPLGHFAHKSNAIIPAHVLDRQI